jgi:hypothetical protein
MMAIWFARPRALLRFRKCPCLTLAGCLWRMPVPPRPSIGATRGESLAAACATAEHPALECVHGAARGAGGFWRFI